MPVITLEGGKLSKEQKRDLVHRFTAVAAEVTNIPPKFFSVLIREQEDANLGFAGETVEELKARIAAGSSD
jgi:4-oxalocrotonate tautomerase